MKKTALALSLVLTCLLASVLILISPVKAQEPLNLTIKPDGSVEPSTNLLERNGTTYTFKGDIFGAIWVQTTSPPATLFQKTILFLYSGSDGI